jgi:DNA primase
MDKREAKRVLNEVIGHYKETGRELLFTCPVCDHHKRKLSINLDKNAFKCWVCDYRGRNIRRVIRRFGTFTQLQKWDQITNRVDLEKFSELFMERVAEVSKQTVELPKSFLSLANKTLPATAKFAYGYLTNRGVTNDDILRWKIGYCFEGEYRNRVIVPSFNDDGDVNYFIARSYNGDSCKYKNPRVSKNIIFNELFVDWNSDLVIVEGAFDAIIAGNSVPLLGSTLNPRSPLIRKIVLNDTPVYLALDPDAADKERKIIETLLSYDIELYKIDVYGYEDVGSMPKSVFCERKEQASFIDQDNYLLLNLLSTI